MNTTQQNINWKKLGPRARIAFYFWHSIYTCPALVSFEIEENERNLYKCLMRVKGYEKPLTVVAEWSLWESVFLTCRYVVLQQAFDRGVAITALSNRHKYFDKNDLLRFERVFESPLSSGTYFLDKILAHNTSEV